MQLVRKEMGFQVGAPDPARRTLWAVASDGRPDRHGDVIEPGGWDLAAYAENPVVLWAHDMGGLPVARALRVGVAGGRLVFQAQFTGPDENPFGETIFRLYQTGYLYAFSVGFRPLEARALPHGNGPAATHYLRQELLEISAVTVPANPGAVIAPKALAATPNPGSPAGQAGDDPRLRQALDAMVARRIHEGAAS